MPKTPDAGGGRSSLVLDATVLSNFALVGHISLLERLYRDRAWTILMVVDEIRRGLLAGHEQLRSVKEALSPLQATGWLAVLPLGSAEEQVLWVELSSLLGLGEASCLAVAIT